MTRHSAWPSRGSILGVLLLGALGGWACRPDGYVCAGACVKSDICQVPLEVPAWNLGFGERPPESTGDCSKNCVARLQLVTPTCRDEAHRIVECFAQSECSVLQNPLTYTQACLTPLQSFGSCMTEVLQSCCEPDDPCELGQNNVCECPAYGWDRDCGTIEEPQTPSGEEPDA